jgi:hypothetical protein
MSITLQLGLTALFLAVNIGIITAILAFNRRQDQAAGAQMPPPQSPPGPPPQSAPGAPLLDAQDILGKEYLYAQNTASEAMRDRHTMINFFLIFVGFILSGVVAVARDDPSKSKVLASVLLWLLCSVGWLYFLKIIRLRQAWYDSARAMNQIKEFYIVHVKDVPPEVLRRAFRWLPDTLPAPEKPWTLIFLSAMTVALLDSVALVMGGILLEPRNALDAPLLVIGGLGLCGLVLLAFYAAMYRAFLTAVKR